MNQYFSRGSSQVFNITNLNLATLISLQNTVNKGARLRSCARCLAIRYLSNSQSLIVSLLNFCTNTYRTTSLAIIILRDIYASTCWEVGIEMELLTVKVADGCITNLNKVVGKYLTIQADSNTLCALSKKQRELNWQRNRLLVSAIIAPLPFCRLGVKNNIQRKL